MTVLNGRAMAAEMAAEMGGDVDELYRAGVVPALAVLVSGEDAAARSHVRVIERAAGRVGVACRVVGLPASARSSAALAELDRLGGDDAVHGIMIQTPLRVALSPTELAARIPPGKDVDGMNPTSAGRVLQGGPAFAPATAAAVLEILRRGGVAVAGARAVVIGRSALVGKPAALLLLSEHATVTVCHSRTRDLAGIASQADILVAAVGSPRLVGPSFVRPGATVIDLGITFERGRPVGDVDYDRVAPLSGAITPVPGGVGPVTTMLLLSNTVAAARAAMGAAAG